MFGEPKRVQELFLRLVELNASDRPPVLDRECGADVELRKRVEALLKAHEDSCGYLDRSSGTDDGTLSSDVGPEAATVLDKNPPKFDSPAAARPAVPQAADIRHDAEGNAVIAGRYVLQQKIGEGGMGEVWVARQTEPVKRKVALKLIKSGMDSKAVLARFEQERQALAMMEHPNIARVLDGGVTPSGQPFFVMELVNGLPLTKFCDEAMLTPRQRLELFIPICQAVQHAHQKGIVHRDLKPANILVTLVDGEPIPKVIDFGVAKATGGKLTEETMSTQFGAIVGTLEYMSPEQAGFSNVDIDTRADIYSLGVVLYEILTGLRPIDARRLKTAAVMEVIRMIQEVEPSKPSTRLSTDESLPSLAALRQTEPRKLMALLRGELDWVVMKCLEKSRERRYETANALSRDIQRYLADEPVEARPPTTGYRFSKFLKRNRTTVLAASLVLVALVGGIIGTTLSLVRAVNAERLAEDRLVQTELERLKAAELAAAEAEQRLIADRRRQEADQERVRADRNFRMARDAVDRMLTKVAEELRGQPQTERVRQALLDDALQFYQEFLKEQSSDPAIRFETGMATLRVGHLYCFLGQWNTGINKYQQAIQIFSLLADEQPNNASFREQLAESRQRLARALGEVHDYDASMAESERAAAIWDRLAEDWPERPQYLQNSAQSNWEIGTNLRSRYLAAKGAPYLKRKDQLLAEIARRFPAFPIDAKLQAGTMAVIPAEQTNPDQSQAAAVPPQQFYADLPHDLAVLQKYTAQLEATIAYWEQQLAEHPDAPIYQRMLLKFVGNLTHVLSAQERFDDIQRLMDRYRGQADQLAQRYPDNVEYQVGAAWDNNAYGILAFHFGRKEEARDYFRRAISACKRIVERYPDEKRHHTHLLGLLIYCPDHEMREPQRAIQEARSVLAVDNNCAEWGELAFAQLQAGLLDEAEQNLKIAREKFPTEPRLDMLEASIRLERNDLEEARRLFKRATDVIDQTANRVWPSHFYRTWRAEFVAKLAAATAGMNDGK